MVCGFCSGSGACDPCDGYGTSPDSFPNAGDGADCGICGASGVCPACDGTGETDNDTSANDNDRDSEDGEFLGVMT